jgi:hypothetical protein
MGELGTFRSATGELIRCRLDWSGRLTAFREVDDRLIPCDPRALLGAVKLSDDPEWLSDHRSAFVAAAPAD